MTAPDDSDGMGDNHRAGLRVIGLGLAVALGVAGYRSLLVQELPWWRWIGPLVAGAAALIFAFGGGERRSAELPVRRSGRWCAGVVAGAAFVLLVYWQPQIGHEVAAGLAAATAIGAFFLARWVPFAPDDVHSLLAQSVDGAPTRATRGRMIGLTIVAIIAGVAAAYLNRTNHLAAFVTWLASLAVFAAAMWRRAPAPARAERWMASGGPELTRRNEALALLLMLLLALALRVTFLRDVPGLIDPDEGRQGRWAERIWAEGFPDAFGIGWNVFPHLSYMTEYVWVQALGTSNAHLRLSAATIGVLSLIPVFFWVRRWWGNIIALLTVVILATNREHIAWSRLALNNIHQVLVAGLMLAAFARLLRTRRAIDWVWFGYAVGLAFHTYHSAKLFPALLAAAALLFAIGMRGFVRQYAAGAVVGLLAFVLCFGPLFVTIYENWNYFYNSTSNRVDLAQLVDAYHSGNLVQVRDYLFRHVVGCLLSFTSVPWERWGPTFDPFVAVPFLLGVGWMLWRWRDPRHLVVLVWTIGILVIGGMITDYPPWKARMLGFLPTVCLIPAVVAGRARATLLRWSPARGDLIAVPLLVAWLAAALQYNWYTIFVALPQAQRGDIMTAICRAVEDAPLPATIYMVGGAVMAEPKVASNDCMVAANPERTLVDLSNDPAVVPIPATNRGNAVLLVSAAQQELLPLVRHYYPNAHYQIVHEPHYDSSVLHIFTVRSDEIERTRGLRGTFQSSRRTWSATVGSDVFTAPTDVGPDEFPLRAIWRGELWTDAPGAYAFLTNATLHVDSTAVVGEPPVMLAAGWHAVELSADLRAAGDAVTLQWRTPSAAAFTAIPRAVLHTHPAAHGLLGRYYARPIVDPAERRIVAPPDYSRIDAALSFDFYRQFDEPPPPPFAAPASTMEWVGTVRIPEEGQPGLRLEATAPTQVFVNGALVAATERGDGQPVTVDLAQVSGRVPIRVRSIRLADDTREFWKLRVLWRQPGGDWSAFADYRPAEE